MRTALAAVVLESLRPVSFGLGVLYVVYTVSHMLVLPASVAPVMAMVAAATAIVMLGLRLTLQYASVPPNLAHPIALAVATLVLLNSLLHIYLITEPQQTTNILLLILGVGFLFLSTRWLIAFIAVALAGWGLIVWLTGPSPSWVHFGFALFAATVLAILVHVVRVRIVRVLEGLRLNFEAKVQERTAELMQANVHLNQEIAERKRVEQALRESEEKYRTILASIEDGYYEVDLAGNFTFFNDALCDRILGYPRHELVGINNRLYMTTETAKAVYRTFNTVYRTGQPARAFDWEVIRKDGTRRVVEASISLLRDTNGEPAGFRGIVRDITERNQAQEALRESEAKHRLLLASIRSPVLALTQDMTILYCNDAYADFVGRPVEELNGQGLLELFPDFGHTMSYAAYLRALERGEHQEVEGPLGDRRVRAWIYPTPFGILSLAEDVTERRQLERQLEERRQYLENVLAGAPDAIVALDAQHQIVEWNTGAERLFGYTRSEVLGQDLDNLITGTDPETSAEASGYTQRVLAGESIPPTETVRYPKDGPPVNVIVAGSPIVIGDELVGVVAVYTDITERKRAEKEISRRLAQTRALREVMLAAASTLDFDQVLERTCDTLRMTMRVGFLGVCLPDESGKFLRPHPSVIGYARPAERYRFPVDQSVCGQVFLTGEPLLIGDVQETHYTYYGPTEGARSELAVPVRVKDRVIGVLDVESRQADAFGADDLSFYMAIAGQLGVALENARLYAEVRHQAEELGAAVAKLQELDRLKSEFIQNVSHELRSPLALIRGYADLLDRGDLGSLQVEQKQPVSVIARRAQMLGDLVEDITLILEAEAHSPDVEPVALDELIQAAVEDFQIAAHEAQLRLQPEIALNLPPVRASATYLRRVLDNLLGNAVKFTPEGGLITVRAARDGDRVVLEVSDTGIGIPPEEQERVFERFYQVDGSSKRRYGGVGLGLALVKELVESCGGSIALESQVNEGSTFVVKLDIYEE
jgi:PAS domain S-box-containing protein